MNYTQQYSQAIRNQYPYLSYYADLWNQGENLTWRPLRGDTVWIPSMTVSGARAVNRDRIDGVFTRNHNIDWQAMKLTMDREWDDMIDPLDMVQTDDVATIANVTRTFNEQQKIPEQDAYMSSKLAGFAEAFGGVDGSSLTAANILEYWDTYLAYMTNQRINRDRLRCKMTPDLYKLLKQAAGLTRFVETSEGFRGVDRNVARLDGVPIVEIPADMMKTAYSFTEGWEVADGAKTINLILYNPDSLAAPIVYDVSMMSPPTAGSKGKYLYYERYYYDVFALRQRQAGIFANIGSFGTLGTLTVASVAGDASGKTVITVTGKQIGLTGEVAEGMELYETSGQNAAVSLTYGAALPDGATWAKVTKNPFTLTSQTANKYVTVALVNKQTGKVVAGGNTTLVVGA